MKRQTRRAAAPRPLLLAELTVFSWEAMARRASMMMQGTCTAAEYQRMMFEKMRAAQRSAVAILLDQGVGAALAPWHRAARTNVRRLRKQGHLGGHSRADRVDRTPWSRTAH